MKTVIQVDSAILGGTPVFQGTRVPIQNLFDYIEGDETIDEFLTDFPTVTKEQVIQLLEQLKDQALKGTKAAWRSCWMSVHPKGFGHSFQITKSSQFLTPVGLA